MHTHTGIPESTAQSAASHSEPSASSTTALQISTGVLAASLGGVGVGAAVVITRSKSALKALRARSVCVGVVRNVAKCM